MRIASKWLSISPLWILAIVLCFGFDADAGTNVIRRILILHGESTLVTPSEIVARIIRQTVPVPGQPIDYDWEAFDPSASSSPDYESAFAELLRKKYRDRKFDIVIAIQAPVLDFALKHRAALWPKASVVFFGVANSALRGRSLGPKVTGIAGGIDFGGTLGLAFRLQPNAARVVLIGGPTAAEQSWISQARNALRPFESRVELTDLTHHSLAEILATVRTLPRNSIVLYTPMFEDGTGRTIIPRDAAIQLTRASAAPVYSFYERFMGLGIVGGALTNFDANAQRLGKLVARILAGENADSIPVEPPAPAVMTLDWRQLKRWGLDEAVAPRDAVILYRQAPLWLEYRWQILGVAAVLVAESVLICALLLQRRRRKRAELVTEAQYLALAHSNVLLANSQTKTHAILNAVPDLMFIQSLDGVYLDYHCKSACDLLLPPEDFLGRNMREVLPAQLADELLQCFQRAAQSSEPVVHEYSLPIGEQPHYFEARIIRRNDNEILTMVRDITERKTAEQLLRASQNLLKTLMDHSPATVFLKDCDGRYLYINPPFTAITDVSAEEIIGKTDFELFTNGQAAAFRANDLTVIKSGAPAQFEEVAMHADGLHTSVVYKFPLFDADGKTYATGGIVTDITERKSAEEALRQSESLFRHMADHMPAIIWMNDVQGRCTYVNKRWTEFTGTVFAEQLGFGWLESVHPDDRENTRTVCQRAVENHAPFRVEYRVRRRDGEYRAVIDIASPRFGAAGEFLGYIGAVTDITERKQAEEALRESEQRYRNVVETQTELICRFLPDTTLTFVNDAYCRYFDRPREQLIGRRFLEFIPPSERAAVAANVEKLCKNPETRMSEHEHQVNRPDGTVAWQSWANHLLFDAAGRVIEMQAVGRDITKRKRAEDHLTEAISEIHRLKDRLEAENVYLRSEVSREYRYGEMTGESEAIRKVLEQVGQVAPTDMTVLVLGETGVGKELVARLVHEKSARRERPLVKVNCSTLPADLIESELFGHERGAFTGAVARQVGRFELADGGTIFLDEVGELPLKLQVKLLRVLQEGEFERLGGSKTIKVDVRVIAATNRNLSEAAQRGRFRVDLYYRLNVYPIEVAPLRERRSDVGLLARVFLAESERRLGKRFGKISEEVVEALAAYSWPGNVRELENVIARAAVISRPPFLQLPERWNLALPIADTFPRSSNGVGAVLPPASAVNNEQLLTLEQFKRTRILEVLHQTNWRIDGPGGAAIILGLHPNTLRSQLHKLGIVRPKKPRNLVVETTK